MSENKLTVSDGVRIGGGIILLQLAIILVPLITCFVLTLALLGGCGALLALAGASG